MFYADFAESYENDQQDVIQSAYFENQCFSIFTVYCYTKNPNNNDVKNDNAIVITKSFNPQWVMFMSCLQKIVHKIKHMHEKWYDIVWSDGIGSQVSSRYAFKYIHTSWVHSFPIKVLH